MSDVQRPADGGQPPDPSAPLPIRWDDPSQRRRWLSGLRDRALDGLVAGEDATRRVKKRFFSRHEARRRLREAKAALLAQLAAAERDPSVDIR